MELNAIHKFHKLSLYCSYPLIPNHFMLSPLNPYPLLSITFYIQQISDPSRIPPTLVCWFTLRTTTTKNTVMNPCRLEQQQKIGTETPTTTKKTMTNLCKLKHH
ncbi:hypothetical protein MtrunA17_Chr7g0267311 [Medicago truncatula]|uniref:Uncharacterized protein n=1 Tax=Medicago truncatula TaxID=3880 RepID=A0A072UEJ7_MEDTR|nr:hypothetical protein MTR_7g106040 [Medicago truncatula]RHN48770.1 hypothetical protein MtrunA17_Chr7g0267311 [Medicago truncatula]